MIPYVIAGMALVMLVGGVLILAHAFKTWMDERNLRPK
jgi:hypothetical protein